MVEVGRWFATSLIYQAHFLRQSPPLPLDERNRESPLKKNFTRFKMNHDENQQGWKQLKDGGWHASRGVYVLQPQMA
jgi:hypothetical protein